MNQELTSRLTAIKAECRRAIELGEKASVSPWTVFPGLGRKPGLDAGDGTTIVLWGAEPDALGIKTGAVDAAFIAHSRTFSPAAAKGLLGMIEALEEIAREIESDHENQEDSPSCAAITAETCLESLTEYWTELLP